MLSEPKCFTRGCKHFEGVKWGDGGEETERLVCAAFPDGIPVEIAYGNNDHTEPFEGDNGIQFEPGLFGEEEEGGSGDGEEG